VITSTPTCSVLAPDEQATVYIILPNPSTVLITLGANYTAPVRPKIAEFVPPVYCVTTQFPSTSIQLTGVPSATSRASTTSTSRSYKSQDVEPPGQSESELPPEIFITSKISPFAPTKKFRDVTTVITTSKNPVTVYTTVPPPKFPGDDGKGNGKHTVNPAADGGPNGNTDPRPTDSPRGGKDEELPPGVNPIVATVQGRPVEIKPSYAVIGGVTHSYVEPVETGVGSEVDGLQPTSAVVILDGGIFSAIGSSIAVFDGQTLQYGPSSTITTEYHQETITLGESIVFDGTTIGGPANTGTRLGVAGGISVTQIGQSVAVISSTSLTVGLHAVITTVFIDTYTIVANTGGLEVSGTTLTYPFNPATLILTMEGITITKIGSDIIVISGSTYTIGPTLPPTTTPSNRQTMTLGSDDVVPATSAASPESPAETTKKSDGRALRPVYLLMSIALLFAFGVYW